MYFFSQINTLFHKTLRWEFITCFLSINILIRALFLVLYKENKMIEISNIEKKYVTGDVVVQALKGVSIKFREHEFVSILGPSGCGKTTLLNVIGGLDKYDSGDLIIDGVSTKQYKDKDWDVYRNHYIGFVFQSYNLIMHLTVLENVELALAIAGDNKKLKREKAINALEKVGLKDQINKKPNQLSGGQMQRVAIARAIVNNPKIILADEPTGALDSETSLQILDILKELSKECLVIMVTHNNELAKQYSSRIISILDGKITNDTNQISKKMKNERKNKDASTKKTSMGFFSALKLSLRNLGTKKTRTALTAFAGSIGIIGIALILAVSSGFQSYVKKTEEDTMSTYPLTIQENAVSLNSALELLYNNEGKEEYIDEEKVYVNNILEEFMKNFSQKAHSNNLTKFKSYIDSNIDKTKINDIQYCYDINFNVYSSNYNETENTQLNPFKVPDNVAAAMPSLVMLANQMQIWEEMISNQQILEGQYELLGDGRWPTKANEVVLVLDKYNQLNDFVLYALGLKDVSEIEDMLEAMMAGVEYTPSENSTYTFEQLMNLTFKIVLDSSCYSYNETNQIWENKKDNPSFMKKVLDNSIDIKVVGIIRPKQGVNVTSLTGTIGYTKDLISLMINNTNESDVVKTQKENPQINILTNAPFASGESYEKNLRAFSSVDLASPSMIRIYPADFESKEYIVNFIKEYNNNQVDKSQTIEYTDYIGMLLSSVTVIINAITYVLIAFVSISLVVSSIMIGIITYISVLERTKEIGILRSVGARKRDVSRVFNAETLFIGFISGALGIILTYILCIPVNVILKSLVDVSNIAILNPLHALILIVISMLLTFVSGLIPSSMAAKKDPVKALRSE